MKKSISIILALFGILANGQELDCTAFANGTFLVHTKGPSPVTWRLVREGNSQTGYKEEIPGTEQGSTAPKIEYSKLEWINNCTFRITYDESKSELTPVQKFINEINGILIEVTKIEGNCFYYKSLMIVNGREVIDSGKMYKQ
ncbi:hypothetical protein EHW67_19185 [Arenibacter aquaticus]|uniref:Uncharacterized protein n=1 Tax=Arenibacter aquaticus TaxID=2489054 RepID=A0A3S0AX33_9FLAO|nr:hypothetical protein [Arenibacter aquaticus]RTE52305.1 hypothetical protein EHW67_19185 [Arenibacter aquaticus]